MKYQLFPNLTADEFDALTADIRDRGVMVPVELDENGDILDGHHRAMIADSLGIEYPTVIRTGWTEAAKLAHSFSLNANRRQASPADIADAQRRMREAGASLTTIAQATGTSLGTAWKNTQGFSPERVVGSDGKSYPSTLAVPAHEGNYRNGQYEVSVREPRDDRWNPGAVMSSASHEWYTPRHVVDAVLTTMGTIDLDPCAEKAKRVPATTHLTKADDGLAAQWKGRVYMNPPYGDGIGEWTGKLRREYDARRVTEAVALVPARTETDWWESLAPEHICLIHGRLKFSDGDTAAPFPSAAVYLGKSPEAFTAAFKGLGPVYRRVTR